MARFFLSPHRPFLLVGLGVLLRGSTTLVAAPAPVAAPAFVDTVIFTFRSDNEDHKVVATFAPTKLRVDEPSDGYSVIYDPATEYYIGLEHRNYTYWTFSWPAIRSEVESSKRGEAHLQELTSEGLNDDATSTTTAPGASSNGAPSAGADDSGYVWKPTGDRKRIADLDCTRWTGETLSGENVDAWCCTGTLPQVKAAVDRLRLINSPMALVPIRTVVPDFIFPVYDALLKAGVTPLLIRWGGDAKENHFQFVEEKQREARPDLFTVPRLYVKTTLETMDGIIAAQPAQGPRGTTNAPRVDNSLPPPATPGL